MNIYRVVMSLKDMGPKNFTDSCKIDKSAKKSFKKKPTRGGGLPLSNRINY